MEEIRILESKLDSNYPIESIIGDQTEDLQVKKAKVSQHSNEASCAKKQRQWKEAIVKFVGEDKVAIVPFSNIIWEANSDVRIGLQTKVKFGKSKTTYEALVLDLGCESILNFKCV